MNVVWEGPVCWVQCANMWQHCSLSAVQAKTACVELSWWPEFDMFGSMPWCWFPWHKLLPRLAQKNPHTIVWIWSMTHTYFRRRWLLQVSMVVGTGGVKGIVLTVGGGEEWERERWTLSEGGEVKCTSRIDGGKVIFTGSEQPNTLMPPLLSPQPCVLIHLPCSLLTMYGLWLTSQVEPLWWLAECWKVLVPEAIQVAPFSTVKSDTSFMIGSRKAFPWK